MMLFAESSVVRLVGAAVAGFVLLWAASAAYNVGEAIVEMSASYEPITVGRVYARVVRDWNLEPAFFGPYGLGVGLLFLFGGQSK